MCNLNVADATGRLAHWHVLLSEFVFVVVHRKGIKQQAIDALSLLQMNGTDTEPIEDYLPVALIDTDTTDSSKVCHENNKHALVQVVGNDVYLKDGAVTTSKEFLQYLATVSTVYKPPGVEPPRNLNTRWTKTDYLSKPHPLMAPS